MRANNNPQRALAALSAIAVAIRLAISTAPAGHSDEHDDAFLSALKSHDIVPIGDPAALVGWAHWTCDQLAQGAKREHINIWLRQFNFSPGGDGSLEAMFIREAALYYCPEHKNRAGW